MASSIGSFRDRIELTEVEGDDEHENVLFDHGGYLDSDGSDEPEDQDEGEVQLPRHGGHK
jgi:hypothetical protein